MSSINNLQGSANAQLVAHGASVNPSSATNPAPGNDASTSESLYQPGSGARPSSLQDRASTIATALRGGNNVGNTVAADFGSWCQSRGVPKNAASFSTFSQQYSAGLQQAGLSSADAATAIGQGQAAIFSGQQVRNFTLGQGQV